MNNVNGTARIMSCAIVLLLDCATAVATENVFTGSSDSRWFNQLNWTLGLPTPDQDIRIDADKVILTGGSAWVQHATCHGDLRVVEGSLVIRGGLTKDPETKVSVDGGGLLRLKRLNPGSAFVYGGIWEIGANADFELTGEDGTAIALDGGELFRLESETSSINFRFNHIGATSTLRNDVHDLVDLFGTTLRVDGTYQSPGGLRNGRISGTGVVDARFFEELQVQPQVDIQNSGAVEITNCDFYGLVNPTGDIFTPIDVVDSTFYGPVLAHGEYRAIEGTVNVLGEIIPGIRRAFSAVAEGHLRIDIGETGGHLANGISLSSEPGGTVEVLGSTLTVIDSGSYVQMLGGSFLNVRIREIETDASLLLWESSTTLELESETLLNDGTLYISRQATLRNGLIEGTGSIICQDGDYTSSLLDLEIRQLLEILRDHSAELRDTAVIGSATIWDGARAHGSFSILGDVSCDGEISPNLPGDEVFLQGSLTWGPESRGALLTISDGTRMQLDLDPFERTTIDLDGGTLQLDRPLTTRSDLSFVQAEGQIFGVLTNDSLIRIGPNVGTLGIHGSYTQTPSASLVLKAGGTNPGTDLDQFLIVGQASLGGTLRVDSIDGFRGRFTDELPVMKWNTREGTFGQITFPDLGVPSTKGRWVAEYRADGLYLVVKPNLETASPDG